MYTPTERGLVKKLLPLTLGLRRPQCNTLSLTMYPAPYLLTILLLKIQQKPLHLSGTIGHDILYFLISLVASCKINLKALCVQKLCVQNHAPCLPVLTTFFGGGSLSLYSTSHTQAPTTSHRLIPSNPLTTTDEGPLAPQIGGLEMVPGYESDYVMQSSPLAPPYSPLSPVAKYV